MIARKNVFIMGDSYSTYAGYVPDGYRSFYGDERKDDPIVNGAEKTWWKILEKENRLNIVLNDSFSGSTVCNTVREILSVDTSFINRMKRYAAEKFFAEHDIDTVFIFGGTNDSWIDAPVGTLKYSDWTEHDLKCVLPAFCALIDTVKKEVKDVIVIINTDLKPTIAECFIEACKKYDVCYVCLKDVDKQNGHPTERGMEQISQQVTAQMRR